MALGSKNQQQQQQQHQQHTSYYQTPYAKPEYRQQSSPLELQQEQPLLIGGASVVRRNARERNRVKQVNCGFSQLRQHIPVAIVADLSNGRRGIGPGANKKLSKVSTLRMAVEYIRRLQRLIDDNDHKQQSQQQQPSTQQQQLLAQQQHFSFQQQQQQQLLHQQQQQQQQQQFYALQQQLQLISPSGSSCSSSGSTSSASSANYYLTPPAELKLEAEDYRNNSCSSGTEDEDILDYISLWQDDL